jgi:hypothetical protein
VYRITTYPAARIYGSGTKWCITGRYEGHEERGEEYFNDYIEEHGLDGGYYFYIKNDGKTKFCLLRKSSGGIDSIWNAKDDPINPEDILAEDSEFPAVRGIFIPSRDELSMFSKNVKSIKQAYDDGFNINKRCTDSDKQYYGYTPLEWHIHNRNWPATALVARLGAQPTDKIEWRNLYDWNVPGEITPQLLALITSKIDKSEMLEFGITKCSSSVVQSILKLGADPNCKFSNGLTPLQSEVTSRPFGGARIGVIKSLLKAGAIVDNATRSFAIQNLPDRVVALLA